MDGGTSCKSRRSASDHRGGVKPTSQIEIVMSANGVPQTQVVYRRCSDRSSMGVLNAKWRGDRKPSRPARSSWLGVWVQRARSGAPRNATAVIPKFPREHILHLARWKALHLFTPASAAPALLPRLRANEYIFVFVCPGLRKALCGF